MPAAIDGVYVHLRQSRGTLVGGGKRVLPENVYATFKLKAATPYPSGVVGLHYEGEGANQ